MLSATEPNLEQLLLEDILDNEDIDPYQTQKFNAQLHAFPSFQHPTFLSFCKRWIKQHGYGLSEVNRLLEIIRYAQSSIDGKIDLPLTIEDIEHIWITHSLDQHFSSEKLGEDLGRIKWELSRYSPEIGAKFFQHVRELSSAKQLIDFLAFLREYEVAEDELLTVVSSPIALKELREKLVAPIVLKAVPSDFPNAKRIAYQLYRMVNNGWALSSALSLFANAKSRLQNDPSFYVLFLAVELIAEYQLSEEDKDTEGKTTQTILLEHSSDEWVYLLGKLVISARFSSLLEVNTPPEEKALVLVNEVLEKNKDDPTMVRHIMAYSSEILPLAREEHEIKSTIILTDKRIQTWTAEEIHQWCKAQEIKETSIRLSEKLAVLKQAVKLAHGYEARSIQLIAVGLLYQAKQGALAEINTGEGKSIIAAMLATLKALEIKSRTKDAQGNIKIERRVVDVVTSSDVLAQRDAEEQAPFYQLFGLTVAHNIERTTSKPCYKQNIVYGNVLNFVADILTRDDQTRLSLRENRPLDVVVIDEVDNMFVDQASHTTMLTRGIPGFTHLEPILVALWTEFTEINRHLAYDVELKSWIWVEGKYELENGRVILLGEENKASIVKDKKALTEELLKSYLTKLFGAEPPLLHIPNALKSFVLFQQDNWIQSLWSAYYYVEGRDYVVSTDEKGREAILTVDYKNTGVVQQNMIWSNGLHQFLQIKHGLSIKAESLMSRFLSNIGFFKSYQGGMYGMTGTLGTIDEKSFIKEMYGTDFLRIPTYKTKQFLELPPIIIDNENEWNYALLSVVDKERKRGRASLVIVETINQVTQLESHLKTFSFLDGKVHAYSRNDLPEQARHRPVEVGDIIIATNLAGRGTDLKTTAALEKNGGLHVCVAYLPRNQRIQWQAYGRTARQGNKGTGQLIINRQLAINDLYRAYPWYHPGASAEDLLQWRDLAEADRLLRSRYFQNEQAALKDDLQTTFFAYVEKLFHDVSDPAEVGYEAQQMEDLWGIWLKRRELEISYFDGKKLEAADIKRFKHKNAEIRQKSMQELEALITEIDKAHKEQDIITNPAYLTNKGWYFLYTSTDRTISYLDKAMKLDPIYSLGASYLKARAVIVRDNAAKQESYDNLYRAKVQINEWMIPQLESMLAIVNMHAIERNDSPLSKQTLNKIAALKKIDSYIDSTMKIIVESKSDELLRVKSASFIKDVMGWDDSYDPEIQELSEEGIAFLFELNAYTEDKDWFGTMASFALGIVQIVIGVVLTPVTAGLSATLIAGGIGDIISSIKSVITGQPIDFGQYLSNKGVEYAVSLVVAGISTIKESMMGVKQLGTKAATTEAGKQIATETVGKKLTTETVMEKVKNQLIQRGLAVGLAYVAETVLEKGLSNYEGDIRNNVQQSVDRLFIETQHSFVHLFFYDEAHKVHEKENDVRNHAVKLLRSYREKYQNAGSRIIRGVAQNLASHAHPWGDVAFQAAEIGHSIGRISDVTDDFINDFKNVLTKETASYPLPDEILTKKIKHLAADQAVADDLMGKLHSQGFIVNHHIVNTEIMSAAHLPGYSETGVALIKQTCVAVEKADQTDHSVNILGFKKMLIDMITQSIMSMIKGEVLSPLSAMAGNFASKALFEKMQELQQSTIAQHNGGLPRYSVYEEVGTEEALKAPLETPIDIMPPIPTPSATPSTSQTVNFDTDEAQPFTYTRFQQMEKYIRTTFGKEHQELGHTGGLGDVDLLSRTLRKNIHVYKDGVYEKSFSREELKAEDAIRINYDSFDKQWGEYRSRFNADKPHAKWGSLYDIMAIGSGVTAQELRTIASKYMRSNPGETHALLTAYSLDYSANTAKSHQKPRPSKATRSKQEKIKIALLEPENFFATLGRAARNFGKNVVDNGYLPLVSWLLLPSVVPSHTEKKEDFSISEAGDNPKDSVALHMARSMMHAPNGYWTAELVRGIGREKKALDQYATENPGNTYAQYKELKARIDSITGKVGEFFANSAKFFDDVYFDGEIRKDIIKPALEDLREKYHRSTDSEFRNGVAAIFEISDLTGTLKSFTKGIFKSPTHIRREVEKHIGDAGNRRVIAQSKLLPKEIPKGRIDYRKDFLEDLDTFEPGTSKLHHGTLKKDLYIVNYHDGNKILGDGRSISWWTHVEVGSNIRTLEDLHQHLALVKPDWGVRGSVSVAKIPRGTQSTFISGKAATQFSKPPLKEKFEGGGFQMRFRDFDEKWIVETRDLPKNGGK